MKYTANDKAIGYRVYELNEFNNVAVGDYIEVSLPPSKSQAARGEGNLPSSQRVEQIHLDIARAMLNTDPSEWLSKGLA